MTRAGVMRTAVSLAGASFGGFAIGIWLAPDTAAKFVGVTSLGAAGTAMLRSDFGGLFAGMAVLCAAAAWTRSRTWIGAAAAMLAAIVTGRALGWAGDGVGGDVLEMTVEVALVALLLAYARNVAAPVAGSTARLRSLRYVAAAVVIVVVAGVAALLSPAVTARIFAAAAQKQAPLNTAPFDDDALRVAICGSSAPLASASRAKACVAVFAGGRFYVVDVGPESTENLVRWGIPLSRISGVMLTHFHSDHIGDLGELNLQTWAGGREQPLSVYGGPGVDRVVNGFNEAYRLDQGYRTAHHGEKVMPPAAWPMTPIIVNLAGAPSPERNRTGVVFDNGSLKVTAIEVNHEPIQPAYAYRFDYKGRAVVITGDTKYHRPLVEASRNADLLVSEAIAENMTRVMGASAGEAGRSRAASIMHDIEGYHITPEQAASIANEANVRHLAFYHLLPAPDGALTRRLFSRGVNAARHGDWTITEDGSLYTMPIGSTEIRLGRMGR
jgi:ribonuclease Z